jgi:4-hydroxyacetophenone monooxygenase
VAERGRHAGSVITDDDEAITAALADVSVPTLLMSMVHLTGDPSWIRGEDVPVGNYLNEVQGFMDPEAQDRVRARAAEAICAWRDAGCPLPPQPDEALLHEMMNVLVAA